MKFAECLFWKHKVPTVNPIIQETITPKVAIYAVTKALSHHGLNAINKVKAQTTKADRIPPIRYPAPTTKTIVAIAGILKYKALIG